MRGAILVATLMLTSGVGTSDAKIRQLPPSAFPELPVKGVEELQRRGCQIPQVQKSKRSNVIQGEFLKPGQTDWAVLCATKKSTSLLVLENGSDQRVVELAAMRNGFSSWSIRSIDGQPMIQLAQEWNGPKPLPAIDHQGVWSTVEFGDRDSRRLYDYSMESTVLYCDHGRWVKLGTMIAN